MQSSSDTQLNELASGGIDAAIAKPCTDSPSDTALLDAARDGDANAYAALYERHRVAGLRYAASVAGRDLADDLVAESFARIWIQLRTGGGPRRSFRGYLYATIRSQHITQFRKHGRESTVPQSTLGAEDSAGDAWARPGRALAGTVADSAEILALARLDGAEVMAAFGRLPRRWQLVLWMAKVDDIPIQEIGMLLGLKPNAVSQLVVRARRGLQTAYSELTPGAFA